MEENKIEKTTASHADPTGVTFIIAITVIMLTCIVACAGVAITWIINAY